MPPLAPLQLTDVTLLASGDGARARVHRGVLATHSRVLAHALDALPLAERDDATLPLPGKTQADLDALLAFLYPRLSRDEAFSSDGIERVCALAAEWDIPDMLAAAAAWLRGPAGRPLFELGGEPSDASDVAERHVRMLALAHAHGFDDLFQLGADALMQLPADTVLRVLHAAREECCALPAAAMHALLVTAAMRLPAASPAYRDDMRSNNSFAQPLLSARPAPTTGRSRGGSRGAAWS